MDVVGQRWTDRTVRSVFRADDTMAVSKSLHMMLLEIVSGMAFGVGVPMALSKGLSRQWVRSYLAMMMLRAGSRLVRSQRCGGVEMLRKIAEYVKKIFRMEPIPMTVNTLREALQALEVARNHFEHCDPEFVDAAIFELNAAECRVDAARRCAG